MAIQDLGTKVPVEVAIEILFGLELSAVASWIDLLVRFAKEKVMIIVNVLIALVWCGVASLRGQVGVNAPFQTEI